MICLFACFFFMLKLLQYCNYIIIVMQIKLMLLLLIEGFFGVLKFSIPGFSWVGKFGKYFFFKGKQKLLLF